VEGGRPAGLGAERAADGAQGRADDQPRALGGGGLAAAGGQAGPAAEVGADGAADRAGEGPWQRLALAHRGAERQHGRDQGQGGQGAAVERRPPGRLGDPGGRRPHRRVVAVAANRPAAWTRASAPTTR